MSSNPSKKKPTKTGDSGEKPTGTRRSGEKPTVTVKSSATRPVSASKQKGKPPPSLGHCIVEEQMNRNEKMLLDQASELRAVIYRLDEENKRLKAEIRKLDEENTGDNVMNRSHLEKQLSDLKNENKEIKVTIKEKNAEILKLKKDLKDAKEQNRVLSKQNATDHQAHEQKTNFEKELKEKDEAMKQLQEICKSLQEQIDRQKSFKQYGEQPGSEQFKMPTSQILPSGSDSFTLSMSALSVREPGDDDSVSDDNELLAKTSFAEDADERIKDPCAVCFTNRNYPKEATHFCGECGLLGHFLCEQCLSFHKTFTPHKDVKSFVAAKYKMQYV